MAEEDVRTRRNTSSDRTKMTPTALTRANGNSMRVVDVNGTAGKGGFSADADTRNPPTLDHVQQHPGNPDDGYGDDDSVPSSLSPAGDDALVKQSPCDSASTPDTGSGGIPRLTRKASSLQQKPSGPGPSLTSAAAPAPSKPLFGHLPDATAEATGQFQVITNCLYGSKHMGSSDHDAFDCDCAEEWRDGINLSCGEDSDCINRATKMECVEGDCNCGEGCQNQRFQRKQYARVSVIKTEKKGFGLRADADLQPNDFIFEYIGEVINEPTFRRRMRQYDDEGIKHFYFMSLTKSEFVDATRKGNLGRFCNHSCNPNCYVDKWVVGNKLRMGIFAGRSIQAGEELVFDYNVDRYGADPQPCYCGEPICTGFIGGKTQTERATKLSQATIEALGIDDPDGWDTVVAKKQQAPRRKKPSEDDEEYISGLQQSSLAEDGVTKVMAALMQCKEKWIAVKLLARIQAARHDERVLHRVVRMHGYEILRSILTTFSDDPNVVLQVLDILYQFPRLTKNKISDSNIETVIDTLTASEHADVAAAAKRLLDAWAKLETAYRIPRKKPNAKAPHQAATSFEDRRGGAGASSNHESDGASTPVARQWAPLSPLRGMSVPKGPRSNIPQRNSSFYNGNSNNVGTGSNMVRMQRRPKNGIPQGSGGSGDAALPAGWFAANDPNGNVYYYTKGGVTTWRRPTQPADKAPNKAQQEKDAVQEIINSLTKEALRPSTSQTPQRAAGGTPAPEAESKKDKWRALPLEKQKKIYENTLYPHIKSVTDRFRSRLPREEIKKFGKEISKKLVASDYKNSRVDDPSRITARQEKNVKAYVKAFFERAAEKYQELEKKKAGLGARGGKEGKAASAPAEATESLQAGGQAAAGKDVDVADEARTRLDTAGLDGASMEMSDDEDMDTDAPGAVDDMVVSPGSPERKRKRAGSDTPGGGPARDGNAIPPLPLRAGATVPSLKRLKADGALAEDGNNAGSNSNNALTPSTPPPPPPPPPPASPPPPSADDEEMVVRVRSGDGGDDVDGGGDAGTTPPEATPLTAAAHHAQKQREEDEAALQRENEEAMRDFKERSKQQQQQQQEDDGMNGVSTRHAAAMGVGSA